MAAFQRTFRESVAMDRFALPGPETSLLFHPQIGPGMQGMMVEDYGLFRVLSDRVPHEVRVVTSHHHKHHKHRHHRQSSHDEAEKAGLGDGWGESTNMPAAGDLSGDEVSSPDTPADIQTDRQDSMQESESNPGPGAKAAVTADDEIQLPAASTNEPSGDLEEEAGQKGAPDDNTPPEGEEAEGADDAPADTSRESAADTDAQAGDETTDQEDSDENGGKKKAQDPFELG